MTDIKKEIEIFREKQLSKSIMDEKKSYINNIKDLYLQKLTKGTKVTIRYRKGTYIGKLLNDVKNNDNNINILKDDGQVKKEDMIKIKYIEGEDELSDEESYENNETIDEMVYSSESEVISDKESVNTNNSDTLSDNSNSNSIDEILSCDIEGSESPEPLEMNNSELEESNEGNEKDVEEEDIDKKEVENVLDSIISNIENDDKEMKDLINRFKNINKEKDIYEEIDKCVNGEKDIDLDNIENITNSELLNNILCLIETHNIKYISIELNVAIGTVQRWIDNRKVPKSYQFDIIKLIDNKNIDYTKFSYKEKDQFFTPSHISKYCYNKFMCIMNKYNIDLDNYIYIEPSAGDGAFTKILPENSINLDIEPRDDKILKHDFLKWLPSDNNNKYITIGNPPFGLRGNLALRFINHSSLFSEHLCFLLPPLFESDGRGSPMKRVINYNLIYSENIDTCFYDPSGKEMKVNVIMQIWSKTIINQEYIIKNIKNNENDFKIYSLSDGGTSGSTRNKKMLYECDIYIPSTCFGKENMKAYDKFTDLPKLRGYGLVFNNNKKMYINKSKNMDWTNISFLSTNSAYNLRMSKISDALLTIE